MWRTVEKYGINVMQVTGDAMARPLADTLERMQGEVDVSSLVSFGSTAAIFSQTVKEQLQALLPEYLVMTDSVGSTETGMNGIRFVQKGDAPKDGITSVQASADSVVLDENFEAVEPGLGRGRPARARRQHPARLLQRSGEDRGDVRHRLAGPALVDPRRLRARRGRRSHHVARSRFGVDQLGRREDLSRRGRGRAEVAPRRVRRAGRRRGRRTLGRARVRVAATATGAHARSRELREHCRTRIAGYKIPRQLLLVDEVPRLPNGKPDYRSAKEQAKERAARDLSRAIWSTVNRSVLLKARIRRPIGMSR